MEEKKERGWRGRENIYFIQIDFLWHIFPAIESSYSEEERRTNSKEREHEHMLLSMMLGSWNFKLFTPKRTTNKRLRNWKWFFFVTGKLENFGSGSCFAPFLASFMEICLQVLLTVACRESHFRAINSNNLSWLVLLVGLSLHCKLVKLCFD